MPFRPSRPLLGRAAETGSLPRIFAAGALLALATGPALAHAHLTSETPAADAVSAAPDALTLQFSEGLELRFTGATLTGPNGGQVATGPARLAPGDPARLVVPVTGKLAPGAYRVDWRAVATDGHRTSGSYSFTVAP